MFELRMVAYIRDYKLHVPGSLLVQADGICSVEREWPCNLSFLDVLCSLNKFHSDTIQDYAFTTIECEKDWNESK